MQRKHNLFHWIRVGIALLTVPLIYFFWEWGGAEALLRQLHPPAPLNAIRVGRPAPDFVVDKNKVWSKTDFQFHSLRGYPVVLHFWATWCGPCLQELPEIIQLAQRLRPQGYSFVAVAIDRSWTDLEVFFVRNPHLAQLREQMVLVLDPESKIADLFGSSRFPETFLIDDRMEVDNKFVGAQPWNDPLMDSYLGRLNAKDRK